VETTYLLIKIKLSAKTHNQSLYILRHARIISVDLQKNNKSLFL